MRRLFFTLFAVFGIIAASAQSDFMMQSMPIDSMVRIGTLENGMKYYIRHNEKPKGQADFYIVSAVGAIQEADDQQGLAHFLEHMAFNGTKNYPGKSLIEMCERNGVKFGANLNASTSFDQTIYLMKDVPATSALIDSMLLVLHDWSHFITLDGNEIDAERGVIKEELRTRDNASWRSTIGLIKALGKGSKYEQRNLIGYLDGLSNFSHESLRNFYKTWYRPDNQTVIVVGDINVDEVEQKILTLMSDIPNAAPDAPVKEEYIIPDNQEPIISIYTDPEIQVTTAMLIFKRQVLPKEMNNLVYKEMQDIIINYVAIMANARFTEMSLKPDAPFIGAEFASGQLGAINSLDKDLFQVVTADGKLSEGFEAIYQEMERIKRHGFTSNEFERAKSELLSINEKAYNNRNDRTNNSFVSKYANNFIFNSAIYPAEYEWQLDSMLINNLNLTAINASCKDLFGDKNQVIVINCPEKEDIINPDENEIQEIISRVSASEIKPYEDNTVKEPLIADISVLKGSPVVKTTTEESSGATEWTLKNGIKVVVMPTKNQADQILLDIQTRGGNSLAEDGQYYTTMALPDITAMSGLSKFSTIDLQKQLAGINADAQIYVNNYSHGINASCTPKDLESMMQLVYLRFMSPRFNEEDFNTLIKQYKVALANQESNPDFIVAQKFNNDLYGDNYRRQQMTTELLNDIKFADAEGIYKKLFAGADDFKYIFVGNIDIEKLKPLVEKYIGSLPTTKKDLTFVDDKVRPAKGEISDDFKIKMQQPKVSVYMSYSGNVEYNIKNQLAMSFLTQILNTRYTKSIREEKGGTYSVSVTGSIASMPIPQYLAYIIFDTNTEMVDELIPIIYEELRKIATNGPSDEDFNAVKEYMTKNWKVALQSNSNYLNYLIMAYFHDDMNYFRDYEKALNMLTPEDVKNFADKLLDKANNHSVTIMRPE